MKNVASREALCLCFFFFWTLVFRTHQWERQSSLWMPQTQTREQVEVCFILSNLHPTSLPLTVAVALSQSSEHWIMKSLRLTSFRSMLQWVWGFPLLLFLKILSICCKEVRSYINVTIFSFRIPMNCNIKHSILELLCSLEHVDIAFEDIC